MQYRHEWKHEISYADLLSIRQRLRAIAEADPHAINGVYHIRSLYFDDYFNSAYEEKEMGVYFRKKYRIRVYNCQDSVIRLERKIKQDKYIYKESAPLSRVEFYRILDGDYGFLLESDHNLLREFYFECISNFMRPRVIVDYDRNPYILDEGTVRVTFDKKVRAAVESFDIFNADLPTLPAMPKEKLIMEVKFTEFLPKLVRELLPPKSSELVAASKYVMCCDKTAYLVGQDYYIEERNLV